MGCEGRNSEKRERTGERTATENRRRSIVEAAEIQPCTHLYEGGLEHRQEGRCEFKN